MPQLDTTFIVSQLFWLSIFFVIFFLFIRYVIVPKMDHVYSERSKIKDESEKSTEKLLKEIDSLKILHAKKAEELREEIQAIRRDSAAKFEEYSSKAAESLNKKINSAIENTESEIAKLKSVCFDSRESKELITDNAQKIIEKISGIKISKQDLEKVIRSSNA